MKKIHIHLMFTVMLTLGGTAFARERSQETCAKDCESLATQCEAGCKEQMKKSRKADPSVCGRACKDVVKSCVKACGNKDRKP